LNIKPQQFLLSIFNLSCRAVARGAQLLAAR